MIATAQQLNTHFNSALRSKTEREFYQGLYVYYDFVTKTPELFEIFKKSETEHRWRHSVVAKMKPDRRRHAIEKFEQTSLYANAIEAYAHVYEPIFEYKNSDAPDIEKDPLAVILMHGLNYALELNKWPAKDLRTFSRLFSNRSKEYDLQFRQVQALFLEKLAGVKTEEVGE